MAQIRISHLTFAYPGNYDDIFTDVSFSLDTDWKLGFIGRNGRGKTTFLQLLMGRYPFEGSITSPVDFAYFPFLVERPEEWTLSIAQDLLPCLETWALCRELSLLEVEEEVLYRPFSTLSQGEQTKVLLALMFLMEGRFLLVDEPTNHLDLHGREVVSRYLSRKHGFILVSHDRSFLDGCVDHVLSLNRTGLEVQQGNFSSWWKNKEYRDQFEQGEQDRLRKDIGRLTRAAGRTAGWSHRIEASRTGQGPVDRGYIGHKSAKMMKRAKAIEQRRERAIAATTDLLQDLESAEALKLFPLRYHSARLAECQDVTIMYGERGITNPLCVTIAQGERLAVTGPNGAGKSSLLRLLAGEEVPHRGSLRLGSGLTVSYVPQDPSFLHGNLLEYARECGIDQSLFLTILRKLDFSRSQFEKNMENFSAGQKKKVLIARSLCEKAHLYLWDEPLNYLDVWSRMQVEELLLDSQPTMVFVEHDAAFCQKVATKRLAL